MQGLSPGAAQRLSAAELIGRALRPGLRKCPKCHLDFIIVGGRSLQFGLGSLYCGETSQAA